VLIHKRQNSIRSCWASGLHYSAIRHMISSWQHSMLEAFCRRRL